MALKNIDMHNLDKAMDVIFSRIQSGENIVLFRMADGEHSLMLGKPVLAQEGWKAPSEVTPLGKALLQTMDIVSDNVYYGISCPCCDLSAYYWYCSRISSDNITFSNIFVNKNYQRFINKFEELTRDAVVIANHKGKDNKIGNLNVLKYYSIGDQCVPFFETELDNLIDTIISEYGNKRDLLYVVSAGPLSEIIIHQLYKNNPDNTYIDFGSSIDCYIHKKDTRPYTNPLSEFGSRNCWMFNPKTTDFDVSVVLTTYKKPDALPLQLEALQKQSLRPKEILLFQDGISGSYSINFKKEILEKFDNVKIAPQNMGVWERFAYAKDNVKSKYVCVFDDDTIPGTRWLENCHYHMMQEEGVYGTVGILLEKPELYPYDGFFRVGWHRPNTKVAQVDFVGHSWFFKKEYLDYMFDNTEKYQTYKYAAEDMCLSFKCKEHGIKTFVPPHPYWDLEQWGSKPRYGIQYGNASTAISQNHDNCINMRNALNEYMDAGWSLCIKENARAVKLTNKDIEWAKKKQFIKRVIRAVKKRILKKEGI